MPVRRRPLVYLAARYSRRAELIGYATQLRELGLADVECRWLSEEHDWTGEADTPAGLEQAQRLALDDLNDVARAHAVIVFTEPAGTYRRGGSLVELGMAIGLQKHTVIVGPAVNVFCTLPVVVRYTDWPAALTHLLKWKDAVEQQGLRNRLVLS